MTTRCFTAVALCLHVAALPALAQKPAKTASQFYLEYSAAFEKAKSVDDLVPYLSKEGQEQLKNATPAEKKQGFEMMKMMGATKVKVLKETATADGATLDVEGASAMSGGKTTGTVTLVKAGDTWQIKKESWSEKSGN